MLAMMFFPVISITLYYPANDKIRGVNRDVEIKKEFNFNSIRNREQKQIAVHILLDFIVSHLF